MIFKFFEMYLYLCSEIQWHIYEDNQLQQKHCKNAFFLFLFFCGYLQSLNKKSSLQL